MYLWRRLGLRRWKPGIMAFCSARCGLGWGIGIRVALCYVGVVSGKLPRFLERGSEDEIHAFGGGLLEKAGQMGF